MIPFLLDDLLNLDKKDNVMKGSGLGLAANQSIRDLKEKDSVTSADVTDFRRNMCKENHQQIL